MNLEEDLSALGKEELIARQSQYQNEYNKYKNIQTAYKLLNNSGYGAFANRYFRWFDNRLAEGITSSGQATAKYVAVGINKFMNNVFNTVDVDYVIYQDTDSAYVNCKPVVDKLGLTDEEAINVIKDFVESKLSPKIENICSEFAAKLNAYENKLSMKLEKICNRSFFICKKRYALNVSYDEGIFYSKPKLKVTGLETVRSSVPKFTRDAMTECFKLMFDNKKEELYEFVYSFRNKFFTASFDEIGAPMGVKNLEKYYNNETLYKKACPIHVRGSLIFNRWLKETELDRKYELIYDFDKVKYCYLNVANPTHENVISIKGDPPTEFHIEEFIDYEKQWIKTFLRPMQNICKTIGVNLEAEPDLNDIF